MSNSIWHDRSVELPEDVFANSVRPCVIAVDENKKFIGANYGLRGSIPEIKYWARVDDLIAQADKAERLQKAVDLAVLRLEQGKNKFGKSKMGPNKEVAMLCEIVIDEIRQLIKEQQ